MTAGSSARGLGLALAAGALAVLAGASGRSAGAPGTDGHGEVFGKHDGRRSESNPYTQRIDEIAKRPISGGDGSVSVLAARFALMGKPLEPSPPPPSPPPTPTPTPTTPDERATRFDQ